MNILAETHQFPNLPDRLWIHARVTSSSTTHCGLIYLSERDELRLLHFAFHHELRDDEYKPIMRWGKINLDETNQLVLSVLASRIAGMNPNISYAFDESGAVFNADGTVKDMPLGEGMTCATFVVAFFRTYAFEIIKFEGWHTRLTDIGFQNEMVATMEKKGASKSHVALVRSSIPAKRLRPEEVAGAVCQSPKMWPVSFADANLMAKEILEDLRDI